jgi:hypothetical protein
VGGVSPSPGADVGGIPISGRPTPMNERSALHCPHSRMPCLAAVVRLHAGASAVRRGMMQTHHTRTHTHARARAPSPESPLVLQGRVHDGRVCSDAVGCAGRIADKWSQIGRDTADSSKRAHRRDRRCRRAALPMRSLGLPPAHSRTRTHAHAGACVHIPSVTLAHAAFMRRRRVGSAAAGLHSALRTLLRQLRAYELLQPTQQARAQPI